METVKEIVSYSFHEKFFQVEPEGRIRRYQFCARLLSIGIVLGLPVYLGAALIMTHVFNPIVWILFGSSLSLLLASMVLFFMYRVVYMKRLRDI